MMPAMIDQANTNEGKDEILGTLTPVRGQNLEDRPEQEDQHDRYPELGSSHAEHGE